MIDLSWNEVISEVVLFSVSDYTDICRFDVCVTVHQRYNNINSQLGATITNFIDNYNQLSLFRAIISPIVRSNML